MKMHLVFVIPNKEVLPREQMTSYQSINPNENTKNDKSTVVSMMTTLGLLNNLKAKPSGFLTTPKVQLKTLRKSRTIGLRFR